MSSLLFHGHFLRRELKHIIAFSTFIGAAMVPSTRAQEIRIRVLNAHNGRPVTNECINVSLGPWHGADLLAPTNRQGTVVLHLRDNELTAETGSPSACNGLAVAGPKRFPGDAQSIAITSDYYADCQPYTRVGPQQNTPPPSYSIQAILESGTATSNACGKFRTEARRGELVLFVRSLHWWEGLKR